MRLATSLCLAALAGVTLTACTSDPTPSQPGSTAIAVAADDGRCQVAAVGTTAGTVTFRIANTGSKVTEFYVYATGDQVMGEVENITPGLTRELSVELPRAPTSCHADPGWPGRGSAPASR